MTAPADRWLYFLCHGDELDTDALPPALDLPEIHQALGELQMMTQSELERDRYEARLKMQRDIATAVNEARREGHKEGRVEELLRLIPWCQRALQLGETPDEQLRALPLEELERLADQLKKDMTKKLAPGE